MAVFDLMSKLEKLDYLIRSKSTGTSKSLSKKLGVSERQVFNYLTLFKDLDAPVTYCPFRQTYLYEKEGKFNFRFSMKDLDNDEQRNIRAGFLNHLPKTFLGTELILQGYKRTC
ncbi:hypothetical protein [uncultured Imperialibacter sp.]|uniref:hypothetical protein n=1 Tax=uncultured Imperialibacter sp. TaxID=1672639 RepID=UPI0030DBD561|tara:strand:+ start:5936 stop:6277 length:342 start_codon:yes stop_codon:yes gene_type:complete